MKRGFVSDNCAGAHPDIMNALLACNVGHSPSYGDDPFCKSAMAAFERLFGRELLISFVFNGTGANVLSLACLLNRYESVLCADCAHIYADETGAPERVLGVKLQSIASRDGKLRTEDIQPLLLAKGNPHHAQPRVISITNVTEWGTVYTPAEIRALADFAHESGMLLHMDGARIANAVVACGCTMADMTWKAGVDVLSFGGVKNGTLFGEAVIFFAQPQSGITPFMRKNITQLQSKMRFIGAQFEALLSNNLWEKNARHANEMAGRLERVIRSFAEIEILHPMDANMIFLRMPAPWREAVSAAGFGSDMGEVVRMVTAWDTQEEEIEALSSLLHQMASRT